MAHQHPSTALVVLGDTFAGKSLCFCQLGGGNFSGGDVSVFGSVFAPTGSGGVEPRLCKDQVLDDVLSLILHQTEIVLGSGIGLAREDAA